MTAETDVMSNEKPQDEENTDNAEINKMEEPENAIKGIYEIPKVLKEEGVKQPLVYVVNTINGKERTVVLLGETHTANKAEERAASRILPYFKHIACEGVDVEGFIEGRFFFWVMEHIMTPIISILIFWERRSSKNLNSLAQAGEYRNVKTKNILMLEKGWKPSIRTRIFFIVLPLLFIRSVYMFTSTGVEVAKNDGALGLAIYFGMLFFAIALLEIVPIVKDIIKFLVSLVFDYVFDLGPSRERIMVKNLVDAMNTDEAMDEVIVLTGSGHTMPIAKRLKKKYGFVEKRFANPYLQNVK